MSKLAAVVLNYNDAVTTMSFIKAIEEYEIIKKIVVVDNCSTDNSFAILLPLQNNKVDVIKSDKNGGYGYGNNYGIQYLNNTFFPTHILICNPDVQIEERVLEKMLRSFDSSNNIAVVAPFMLDRNGKREAGTAWKLPTIFQYIISAEIICGHFLKLNKYKGLESLSGINEIAVDCVAGSLLMVDNDVMLKYGMYDENIFLFGEETTLGYKLMQAGFKTVLLLDESFLHLHGVSINKSISSENKKHKLMLSSRLYILKHYLGANWLELCFARAVFALSILEYKVILLIWNR